ncbi:MAG TPA: hypothetical protein VFN67_32040 [Polyangiales bacterium]|nr:hypothetical protein [Polyangiales bacterium]
MEDKLAPLAKECAAGSRGTLALEVRLVPDGKLDAAVERLEVAQSSELRAPALTECLRERTKTLKLKLPLPGGPEELELRFPIE